MTHAMTRAGFGISTAAEMDTMMRVLSAANAGPPAEVAIKLLIGNAAGLSVGESLSQVTMIKGRPTIAAAAQLAIIQRAGVKTRWVESTDRVARLRLILPWDEEPVETAYSMDEAKAAGLTGSDNYRKHPAAMLRARCITTAIRMHCPGLIGGAVYDADEIADIPASRPASRPVMLPAPASEPAPATAPDRARWEARAVDAMIAAGIDPAHAVAVIADCPDMAAAKTLIDAARAEAERVALLNNPTPTTGNHAEETDHDADY